MANKKDKDVSVLEGITIEEDEEEVKNEQNTLQDALKAIGNQLFNLHPRKKSNLSRDNTTGLIQCEVLNDYMERNFNYRYDVLDTLIKCGGEYPLSIHGFGLDKNIEAIKSIQASYEQSTLSDKMKGLMR
jgi:hypothetical protein